MDFSFNTTAGASQSTTKPRLEGNIIHEVKFDGCEIKDVAGVKDVEALYKQLILKFSNEDGVFEHTVWEPRKEDFDRRENEITNKQGNKEKVPQPSNVESMMLLFKHAIDTLNPSIAKEIDAKTKILTAPNWDALRKLVFDILEKGKGITTKIKLVKHSKTGEAIFSPYFAGISREGKVYVKNNFIGDKVGFTAYELQKINDAATAVPKKVDGFAPPAGPADQGGGLNLNFNVSGI